MEVRKEVKEENIYTALFTAGVVLSMACLKRLPAVTSLVEQWRAWVFLVLNLVLLAIFFTSTRAEQDIKTHRSATKFKSKGKKRTKRMCVDFEGPRECQEIKNQSSELNVDKEAMMKQVWTKFEDHAICHVFDQNRSEGDECEKEQEDEIVHKEDVNEANGLSDEELNERVEAFIAMFRQHLVSDARKCRERERVLSRSRQAKVVKPQKGYYSNMNHSAREVNCSV